jgi:hypothetical protein
MRSTRSYAVRENMVSVRTGWLSRQCSCHGYTMAYTLGYWHASTMRSIRAVSTAHQVIQVAL